MTLRDRDPVQPRIIATFWEKQDRSRRRIFWLSVVGGLTLFVTPTFLGMFVGWLVGDEGWGWLIATITSCFSLTVCLLTIRDSRRGGPWVAEQLFATEIHRDTAKGEERQLFHIVEEMSLASGHPRPGVWVITGEPGINAFAAGLTDDDAVIGVTDGLLKRLDRAATQAVVAHIYSHIIHGDMRMNMQLTGIVSGLNAYLKLGSGLMHANMAWLEPQDDDFEDSSGQPTHLAVPGAILYALGYPGTLMARIIQAEASCERDWLADAAAVQFTRNPRGLSHALQEVEHHHSHLMTVWRADFGHFFFAESEQGRHRTFIDHYIKRHPPVSERIARLGGPFEMNDDGAKANVSYD